MAATNEDIKPMELSIRNLLPSLHLTSFVDTCDVLLTVLKEVGA